MPVTVKLSQRFYERLGTEVANELVDWLNAVDTGYRQEFKELFEANFGRVEARLGGVESGLLGRMEALESQLRGRLDALRSEVVGRMDALESRVDAKLEGLKSELLRWMFLFWVGTMGTVLALLKL